MIQIETNEKLYLHFCFQSTLTCLFNIFRTSHVYKHKSPSHSWNIQNYLHTCNNYKLIKGLILQISHIFNNWIRKGFSRDSTMQWLRELLSLQRVLLTILRFSTFWISFDIFTASVPEIKDAFLAFFPITSSFTCKFSLKYWNY